MFHGHTFTANPTGCAAALASIALLQKAEMQNNIQRINQQHLKFQEQIKMHPKVKTTRESRWSLPDTTSIYETSRLIDLHDALHTFRQRPDIVPALA